MANRADARKQQQQLEESGSGTAQSNTSARSATVLADQEQRKTLKFGFSSKGTASKVCAMNSGIDLSCFSFLFMEKVCAIRSTRLICFHFLLLIA